VLLALLAGLNGLNTWSQAHTAVKTDFRGATRYVLARLEPDDLVLFQIPYGRYSFDYYLAQQSAHAPAGPTPLPSTAPAGSYRWAEGLYTNAGMAPGEAERLMAEMTAGSRVVWLIESEAPMWDQRGLVHAWLDKHARQDLQAQFTRVGVYRYVLGLP
jgi:hypothetical protein